LESVIQYVKHIQTFESTCGKGHSLPCPAFELGIWKSAITSVVVLQPLTVWYLNAMVRRLRDLGYSHLCLPLLALLKVIADNIVENQSLANLVHLQ